MSSISDRFQVDIAGKALYFEASPSVSLLQAARDARIRLPSSCRNGTCRTCMCRLLSGQVTYAIEWPGLSPEEKREGYILPCVARAASDLIIDVLHARSLD